LTTAKIFEPLKMSQANFGPPNARNQVDQPWGHHDLPGPGQARFRPFQMDNPAALGPAGTVHLAVADWARFLDVQLHPESHTDFLSAAQVARLRTPFPTQAPKEQAYAGGWIVKANQATGELALGHSGSNTAWLATVRLFPQAGSGYIAVTNYGGQRGQEATDRGINELMKLHPPQPQRRSE
jgi:CubicO group peptidase (beta-lactamase class C family)